MCICIESNDLLVKLKSELYALKLHSYQNKIRNQLKDIYLSNLSSQNANDFIKLHNQPSQQLMNDSKDINFIYNNSLYQPIDWRDYQKKEVIHSHIHVELIVIMIIKLYLFSHLFYRVYTI